MDAAAGTAHYLGKAMKLTPELLAMLVKEMDDAGPGAPCACTGRMQYEKPGPGRVIVTMPYCYCQREFLIAQAVRELHALRTATASGEQK